MRPQRKTLSEWLAFIALLLLFLLATAV